MVGLKRENQEGVWESSLEQTSPAVGSSGGKSGPLVRELSFQFWCQLALCLGTEALKPLWPTCLLFHKMFGGDYNRLLLLSHFSRVQLCVTPETAAHQAPPPLGFSRQEHWSGLPFPSPMHESEKWKWSGSVTTLWTAAHQAPPSMGFSRQEHWSGVPLPSLTCDTK